MYSNGTLFRHFDYSCFLVCVIYFGGHHDVLRRRHIQHFIRRMCVRKCLCYQLKWGRFLFSVIPFVFVCGWWMVYLPDTKMIPCFEIKFERVSLRNRSWEQVLNGHLTTSHFRLYISSQGGAVKIYTNKICFQICQTIGIVAPGSRSIIVNLM